VNRCLQTLLLDYPYEVFGTLVAGQPTPGDCL